ncbi:WXG100 family type VII secretion target [Streptantibioticus silvisoli]|uniref:WXG100 family type VII secretion target n=1 Tax=Streptantibioticus silvisoli TaxID=2705255 RepID=A0ABT6W768_9ACTN|nr:hypothetical protein [Streptantibioticus silvisoli]MDI5965331.1 hypothetical protein [Streptantibioticus silvisoli]
MRADETGGGAPSVCGPSTDFESLSHREMLAMLVGVNQRQVTTVATNLTTAGAAIQEIAADLNTHMSNLDWQSTAGDAFRTWGHKVASATYTLADYATTAGTQMSNAGSVLHEVSTSMPAIPEGAVTTAATYRQHKGVYGPFGDAAEGTHAAPGAPTPTAGEYNAAVAEMSAAQTKAADNMIKLGSAYSAATETMGGQQEPEFPPLPEAILPPDPRGVDDASHSEYFGGSSVGAPSGAAPGAGPATAKRDVTGGGKDPGTGTGTIHVDGIGDGRPGGGTHVAEPPATLGTPHGPGGTVPVPPPATVIPGEPGTKPLYSGGPSRSGGRGSGALGPGDDEGGLFGGSSGGGIGGRSALRTAMGEGIEGGTLVEPPVGGVGGSPLRFSAGTVVGDDPAGTTPGMSEGIRAGAGSPFGRPSQEASYERSGGSGFGEPGAGGAGQGGSRMGGLPLSGSRRDDRARRGGSRPDYLVEEEETWASGDIDIVPSVLE